MVYSDFPFTIEQIALDLLNFCLLYTSRCV